VYHVHKLIREGPHWFSCLLEQEDAAANVAFDILKKQRVMAVLTLVKLT
jgi:hypothetical protein